MAAKVQSLRPINCAGAKPHITNVYCGNQTGIPGITMHYLAKDETMPQTWIPFVRIQRKLQTVVKCCTHIVDSCFDMVDSEDRTS